MSDADPRNTPMFQQFFDLKARVPDAVLLFRMGDFYETFFEDAVIAARVCEVALTSRNKSDPEPIPMAGVPWHSAAGYVQKLVDAGHRVAIAEQVEDPALAKGLVRREIVRFVTPGIPFDPNTLDQRAPNRLVAVVGEGARVGLAFFDPTTGDLRVTTVLDGAAALGEVQRLEPREALLGPGAPVDLLDPWLRRERVLRSDVDESAWGRKEALRELVRTLGVADASALGVDPADPSLRAAGAVVRYVRDRSGGQLGNVHQLAPYTAAGFLVVDDTTRRNLELFKTLVGGRRDGSLLGLLDHTATALGARRLRDWIAFPLLDAAAIRRRQAAIQALVGEPGAREDLIGGLREVADIERIVARVTAGTAGPRELSALRRSLSAAPRVFDAVGSLVPVRPMLPGDRCEDVALDLATWLVDEPPATIGEGGVIRGGADVELDGVVAIALDGVGVLTRLEDREKQRTGIASLKVRKNNVSGWYIEVTRSQVHKVPVDYLRKSTLSTGERYVTAELKEIEERLDDAEERRVAIETRRFAELRERVAAVSDRLLALARAIADLDVVQSLAEVAAVGRWVVPELVDAPILDVIGGRHPVVEAMLEDERFVPNDAWFDAERRVIVLTGPNMAGKSTVLRQVALIVILAHLGSLVPAERARVGLCDRVFSRVGAVDDLARGQSTFMVEMAETAAILHQATARSVVILDEIGRGTSTYDGLAIAWAVGEALSDLGCRAIFATHYHELCDLAEQRANVANQSVAVHESGDRIVFLRRLKEGGASRSYGIQCARIAGLPAGVIERAKELLRRFEKHAPRNERQQLRLFGAAPAAEAPAPTAAADPLRDALLGVDPDALSPKDALALVYTLRGLV